MTTQRCASVFLVFAASAVLLVPAARADPPHAIAVADDVSDRIMLFDPHTGDYTGDLGPGDPEHLIAPFDSEIGPALVQGEVHHPDTILVSDLRRRAIVAFDAADGSFIRTLIGSVNAHGLAYAHDGRLLVAAGADGIRAYTPGGTFVGTRVTPEPVDGPKNAWDVLVRPRGNDGAGDMLVADPTLDVILQFDLDGNRLGVFAKLPSFNFVEQLAVRSNRHVLAVDVFADAVHEFQADGTWVRTITVTRPRGVLELFDGNLLVASEQGVQVYDGQSGELLATKVSGYPVSAPRYIRYLRCRVASVPGDLDGNRVVDSFDIDAFVLALTDPQGFDQQYPNVDRTCAGDLNHDGVFDTFDIDPFIDLLTG